MTTDTAAVLKVENLSKTFVGTKALSDVNFDIRSNEVHALVGQNGSGKSTLIKVLAGYHQPDPGGRIWINGELIDPSASTASRHDRLRFVHQDLGLVLELGVMDNLALRHNFIRGRFGRIDWPRQAKAAEALLRRFDVSLDLRAPLSEATPVQRVIVAIVAALQQWDGDHGVLVLDEPTAVLPPHEVQQLFAIISEVRRTGASVLYVSHRLDEIFRIADRVTVLRGGMVVATDQVSAMTVRSLASLMAGKEVDSDYRVERGRERSGTLALEARSLKGHYLRDASFALKRGEILGVAGLLGSGREELPYLLAGTLGKAAGGQIRMSDGEDWRDAASARALRLPLVPADRAGEAIVAEFTVRENLSISSLNRFGGRLSLNKRHERAAVNDWMTQLDVKARSIDAPITTLSGGNQQKVIIARCLADQPRVLLLCEPTAGVDVSTRVAIYELLARQAEEGLAVVVSSSDLGDLLAMCGRILVLRDGVIVRELAHDEIHRSSLLHAMEGSE
ncbi:MAG TPA: sugar ABC transporter ATP-binding protein [Solirubrobacteraceae bacterium]|nr:sugar ABC transporter ATP-binding protein [Solirubrobacteraceae bacterium]